MNIHITDKSVFQNLKQASLVSCRFGSVLYNTNDEFSDVDLHYVYTTSVVELNSYLKSHHHLQLKEEGIDHIFVNLHTFLNNLIKGDSTVLFEILQSDLLKGTDLDFLYGMRTAFISYAIVRSYLGFARRDCQHYFKAKGHREQIKSLGHIWRGYYFAKSLIEGNFTLINEEFLSRFKELKSIGENEFKLKKLWLEEGSKNVTNLREEVNRRFNNNTLGLPKYMTIENQKLLDNHINNLMQSESWKQKQKCLNNFDLTAFYDAFENEINY
jgi:predicted nucleotidyltransferase